MFVVGMVRSSTKRSIVQVVALVVVIGLTYEITIRSEFVCVSVCDVFPHVIFWPSLQTLFQRSRPATKRTCRPKSKWHYVRYGTERANSTNSGTKAKFRAGVATQRRTAMKPFRRPLSRAASRRHRRRRVLARGRRLSCSLLRPSRATSRRRRRDRAPKAAVS